MISVKIKLFAAVRDIVGSEEKVLLVPNGSDSGKIFDVLAAEYPRLRQWKPHLRIAVNCEYVSSDHVVHDQDELALIPPVSGG